jgi:hypothetical protein
VADEAKEPGVSAERLAAHLAERGHAEQARGLRGALTRGAERAVLLALDEVCQTLLSAIEAFDPETEGMIEEFRLSLDRRLKSGPAMPPEGHRPGAKEEETPPR